MAKKKKEAVRQTYGFMLSKNEKELLTQKARSLGLSNSAYLRFLVFQQSDAQEIQSTRNATAYQTIPEINFQTYRQLCSLASSLSQIAAGIDPLRGPRQEKIDEFQIAVENVLLEAVLQELKNVSYQLTTTTPKSNHL